MKPAPFEYHQPSTVDEAVALLGELGEDAKVLAGGQSLIAMLNLRLTAFDHLVDIGRIDELKGVERRNDSVWIGAGTVDADLEAHAEVARDLPLLAKATPFVGHFQIRNRGTIGGSLANADPAAEYPTVALTLDATMQVRSTRGERDVPAHEFFQGVWTTALADDELLTGVSFPVWTGRCGFAVHELARRHGDFAVAGATVAVQLDTEDRIARCAIGLLGLGSRPERARRAEDAVRGQGVDEVDTTELGRLATADLDGIPDDLHGSSAYRRKVGAVMVARAWIEATKEAAGA